MADNSKGTENNGLEINMEGTDKSGQQIAELKEQNEKLMKENSELKEKNAKLVEENAELKQKRPAVEAAELDASSSQKQMKLSSETTGDLDATKIDNIGEKIIAKPKSMLNPNCLYDTLAWIKRKEMADSALSTSSRRFQQLCWPKLHEKVKPHMVEPLHFHPIEDESGNTKTELLIEKSNIRIPIPIASVPPPNYIIGFREIWILNLNEQVMKFMECAFPILNRFELSFQPYFCNLTKEGSDNIDRLLGMLAKKIFSICCFPSLRNFKLQPNANAIMQNVQEFRTDLHDVDINLLINWVTKSRTDQKPKILKFSTYGFPTTPTFVGRIKEEFSRATHSTNFLIVFEIMQGPYFVMENEQTNEVLSSESDNLNLNSTNLFRFPKGKEHLKEDWKQIKSGTCILCIRQNP